MGVVFDLDCFGVITSTDTPWSRGLGVARTTGWNPVDSSLNNFLLSSLDAVERASSEEDGFPESASPDRWGDFRSGLTETGTLTHTSVSCEPSASVGRFRGPGSTCRYSVLPPLLEEGVCKLSSEDRDFFVLDLPLLGSSSELRRLLPLLGLPSEPKALKAGPASWSSASLAKLPRWLVRFLRPTGLGLRLRECPIIWKQIK